jgi:hypothetical protein
MSRLAKAILVCCTLVVACACTSPRLAFAQSNEAAATELFDAGRDLMKTGNFADACPKLAASLRLDAKVGTLARLAECEEHVGQLANAHAHWARALSLARGAHDARVGRIEAEFARVDALVSKISIELSGPAPAGIALVVDGIDFGSASFGLDLPVERGKHHITVTGDGKSPWSTDVDLAGDSGVVKVHVPVLEDAPPASAPPRVEAVPPPPSVAPEATPEPTSVRASTRRYRTSGIVLAGVGGAAMGTAVLVGLLVAKAKLDDSNAAGCSTTVCPTTAGQSERASAITAGNAATGIFVGGAVLAAVGVTLVLLPTRPSQATRATATAPTLRMDIGSRSIALQGTF